MYYCSYWLQPLIIYIYIYIYIETSYYSTWVSKGNDGATCFTGITLLMSCFVGPWPAQSYSRKKSNVIAYSNETWLVFFNTKIKGLYEPPSTVAEILSQISGSLWSHLSGKQNWFFILFVGLVVSGGGGGSSGCGCAWW